jgi:hypothetical protein
MKWLSYTFLVLLLVSCASPAPQEPVETSTPDVKATLIASTPSLEITFDGEECIVEGPDELSAGVHTIVFYDHSDLSAYPVAVRHFSGESFEREVAWVEENCGPPGAKCPKGSGTYAGYQELTAAFAGEGIIHKQYDFKFETEHSIWAETPQLRLWPCRSFQVVAAP